MIARRDRVWQVGGAVLMLRRNVFNGDRPVCVHAPFAGKMMKISV